MTDKTTWDIQTQAFLDCLNRDPHVTPEPIKAEWTRYERHVEKELYEAGSTQTFVHNDVRSFFDGQETYLMSQMTDADMCRLCSLGDVSIKHDEHCDNVTVIYREVTIDKLPQYVRSDVVSGARGRARYQYRTGKHCA